MAFFWLSGGRGGAIFSLKMEINEFHNKQKYGDRPTFPLSEEVDRYLTIQNMSSKLKKKKLNNRHKIAFRHLNWQKYVFRNQSFEIKIFKRFF